MCELFNDVLVLVQLHHSQLMRLLMQCDLIELVQRMWQQCLLPGLLQLSDYLPRHIASSLWVCLPPV